MNTIFEVIKAAGYRTAWSDKHLADEMIQGPSGQGVDDLYLLEINGNNACAGCTVSTTKSLDAAKAFDDLKVKGITNQISGLDHAGTTNVGVPTIFGMNFQAVSVAQRLKVNLQINGVTPAPFPFGGPGGYLDGSGTPSLLLSNALSYTDASIGTIVNALQANGLLASTYIIITAKHGQAPIDPTKLNIVNATNITGVVGPVNNVLQSSGDDALLLWLQNQSNTAAAVSALLNNQANASIQDIWANDLLKLHFPDPTLDPRTPDMIVIGKPGTIYAPKNNKIAEHGGFNDQDVNVPLFISSPSLPAQTIKIPVATAQLAPTILQLLGLNPFALQAVQIEKTAVLPGFEAVEVGGGPPATFSSTIYRSNGQAQFQLSTANAQQFVIQASTDLTNWTPIGTNTLVVGGSATITDLQAGSFSNRFYRAQTP